ncbi:MAG TPA: lipopolysaccharide biosynthesis protein, partial [Trueperaceae bacterium]
MTLKEKTLRGLAWTGIQNWGSRALTFVVFLLLARLLTPEDFGVVALATVFIAFAQVFVDQGFAEALIQREDLEPGHLDTAFWANLGLGVLLSALSFVAAPLVATLFDEPKLIAVVRWLSLLFVLRALAGVQAAILTRDFDFRALAFRRLMGVMAGGVLGVVMAVMGFGVWSLVGQQLCGALVEAGVLWWASDWAPGWGLGREYFKDLFSFGINITGTNLLNFANRRSDDLLIGYFLGPVALGYYTVAYRLLLILTDLLANTINQVALPAFARLQKEPKRLLDAFYKATNLASLVAFPCFVGLAVLAPELTRGVFGEKWLPSVPVMQVLALIGILHSVFNLNAPLMVAVGKPSWRLGV